MRTFHLSLATLAFGAVLAGCSGAKSGALAPLKTTPAEAEAYIAKLSAEPLKGKATAAADVASVRDAPPKDILLTWDTLTFDAAAGATVLTGVKIAPAQIPTIGVGIAELRLWDFDAAFAKARLSGQRLSETASLARRIEAKTISVFGLETLMEQITDQATAAVTDAITDPAVDPALAAQVRAEMQVKLDDYQIGIASLTFDDVMLRPYEVKSAQLSSNNPFADAMPLFQSYAAAARTIAYDTMAAGGLTARLDMTEAGQHVEIGVTADTFGSRGVRGGDTDVAFLRNLKFDIKTPNPELPMAPTMALAGGVDLYTMEGVRFDKLYGYLAKSEWPPRTDTDLMSIGLIKAKGERFALNGHDIYSVGDSTIDARGWYWFIPTKLRFAANDVTYNVDAIMDFVTETAAGFATPADQPGATPGTPPSMPEIDPRIMQTLAKYGLTKPSMDYSIGWDWNPKSGATTIDAAFGLDNYLRFDVRADGALPSFRAVSDLIPDNPEKTDGAVIGKVFETATQIKSAEVNIIDEGGLDKIFNLVVEIGKLMPVEPGQPDFFAAQTPQTLRQLAVSVVYAAAEQAGAQIPAAKELLTPLAVFVEKGGKVHITMKPKESLSANSLDRSVVTGEQSPAVMLQKLNVKVQHTPPAK